MNPQPVIHPSLNSHSSDFSSSKYSGGRGGKKHGKWKNLEQFSRPRPKEYTRELYGHEYTSNERENHGHSEKAEALIPLEHPAAGHFMQPQQDNVPPPSKASVDSREPSVDPRTISFPPFPPTVHTSVPPSFVRGLDLNPSSGDFDAFLTMRKQNYGYPPPQAFDPRGMPMQNAAYMYPQMGQMYPMNMPASPQPNYQQPAYIPGQYGSQAAPMSRNSSQMSEQRPASSMGQPQTPSIPPAMSHIHTPQPKPSAPSPAFTRPSRKNAAILIKRPDGEALDIDAFKAPASPAPSNRARTPPVIASTPTPPPKSATPQHGRTDSAAVKTQDQIKKEVIEKVKKAAEADKAADTKQKEEEAAKAAEAKLLEEQKAKEEAAKAAAEAEAKKAAEEKAAVEKKKLEEEEEMERQIREMEERDAEREKKQAEIDAKRAVDKAAAAKAEAEKKKASAADNDRKLKEAEREMERLEDEKEKKRAEAEAKAKGEVTDTKKEVKPESKDDDKKAPNTPNTLASKLSSLSLRTESGTSTPASDDSMGPPPPKVHLHSEKRCKPAALNLAPLNTKPIEPPQPSAALQSLKSARFLTVLNSSIYPPNIASPNPALNQAVTAKGKSFKYDKEFLLQFQKVFTEKPSLEFESQVKALIGDGDGGSARAGSTRGTPGGMGPRGSNRTQPGSFAMGSFGAIGGKTLPPNTTSEQRYAYSTGMATRPQVPVAISSFRGPGSSFPGGHSISRTSSSSNMSNMPNSPRTQSRRNNDRGGSKRDPYQGGKSEAQAAKTMPLTAGMDLKPIQVTSNGWKPRSVGHTATGAAGPTPGASSGHMAPDEVQRKVKAALNKMTPEKFDKLADQVLDIAAQSKDEADGRTLRQVIQLTFEKATDEAHWASMYAKFCKRMLETMSPDIKDESILDKNGHIVSGGNLFRKYLLNRCQEEFERGWKMDLPDKPEGERGEEKSKEAVMLSDEYYVAEAAKRRGLGLVQFIGELYKLGMLTERIMHECVKKLVDYTGIPDEAEIESLTKLLKTIGHNLDGTEKGKPMMDVYFSRIQQMIDTPELPNRLRFMLMDIVDLRRKGWASKEDNKGPKTLDEIKVEVSFAIRKTFGHTYTNSRTRLKLRLRKSLQSSTPETRVAVVVGVCKWAVVIRGTSQITTMAINLPLIIRRILLAWMTFVVSPTRVARKEL